MGSIDAQIQIFVIKYVPRLVIIWAERVRKAPVCHSASRIMGDGPLEAVHGFFMVEGIGPDKTPIEPQPRFFAAGGHFPVE